MKVRNPFKGKIRKSFLERNQLLIGVLGILFVLGGSGFALLLSGGFFASTYAVTASFADAAGVKGGDEVLVAGLEAGSISGVEIKDGAVEVTMDVNEDVEMPADAQAEIIVETLMGKKSVLLYGGTDDSGQLEDGDSIPLERTDTPVELLDLQDTSVPLLEKSDAESFESFMVSLSEITSGKEDQVTQLLRGFADTTKAIDTKSNELARLIESFKILSTAFADKDETIVSLIDNFDIVLANLSERRAELETLLQATDSASHEIANLVSRNRSDLDPTLRQLHVALDTINQHQLDLAGILSYLEESVQGYQSVGYSQGIPNRWANVFVQSLGGLGIDEFFGPCGAFDDALDEILGEDPRKCKKRAEYGSPNDEDDNSGGGGPGGGGGGAGLAPPESGDGTSLPGEEDMPNDLGDILDSVTGGSTSSSLRSGLE
ncbi:MAG: MCE family protein [Actinomycetota bacterium]|nr:MCE family protein [Actinomycetota bacterium]